MLAHDGEHSEERGIWSGDEEQGLGGCGQIWFLVERQMRDGGSWHEREMRVPRGLK